jgi:hypothetical protein
LFCGFSVLLAQYFLLPKIINCAVHSAILIAKSDVMIFFNIPQKYVLRKFNIFVIYGEFLK